MIRAIEIAFGSQRSDIDQRSGSNSWNGIRLVAIRRWRRRQISIVERHRRRVECTAFEATRPRVDNIAVIGTLEHVAERKQVVQPFNPALHFDDISNAIRLRRPGSIACRQPAGFPCIAGRDHTRPLSRFPRSSVRIDSAASSPRMASREASASASWSMASSGSPGQPKRSSPMYQVQRGGCNLVWPNPADEYRVRVVASRRLEQRIVETAPYVDKSDALQSPVRRAAGTRWAIHGASQPPRTWSRRN